MFNGTPVPLVFDGERGCEVLYTPLEVAQEEIRRRWNDKDLKQSVVSFLNEQVPSFFKDSPCAVFWRHIASPNLEYAHFLKLAADAKLMPICPEFIADKFVTRNPDKYRLAKMYFHGVSGLKNGDKIETVKVIDVTAAQGKRLDEITTLWGEPFVGFHHRLVRELYPSVPCDYDISEWIRQWGSIDSGYERVFALLTCFAVLFENFFLSGHESEFTRTVALPAFHATVARFGVKPLIVRLLPPETETDLYWWCYPASLKPIVDASLRGDCRE